MHPQKIKKILILGSGGLQIGQAGEFDYSGSQAIKAIKEEGIKTVLVNPNIATVQTDPGLSDRLYFLPVTAYFVEKIIKKEKPDGVLLGFGGQTALNVGLELEQKGVLKKYGVQVLGTPVASIRNTEDRKLFVQRLGEINVKTAKSKTATNIQQAREIAARIGYPVMIRAAFSLGGLGSGVVATEDELVKKLKEVFTKTPQVLIEEYLKNWKEVEYEVVRDLYDNCIAVCNMENMDPMGIHTGESLVVAPSQTLNNYEYHLLREIAIKTVRHLKIVGECNIQYALNPKNSDYRVIEINARLSRSSALASKATGYPLAFVAAKLALGYSLAELPNSITKVTQSCFEPALDYLALKIPRWDLVKFKSAERRIGSEMKSVGEVMAIGRNFEEVLQKALRMLNIGAKGLAANNINFNVKNLLSEIKHPTDRRIFALTQALKSGYTVKKLHQLSGIDPWFLEKLKNIVDCEKELKQKPLSPALLKQSKQLGFSDWQIGKIKNKQELQIRNLRKKHKILPAIKQIDTLAGEFPAKTNYLYLTYNARENDVAKDKKSLIVLGSGPYCIGSSVEFDWCCVQAVKTAGQKGYKTIMINCNPETVSTDYDICDRLYFEELSLERVLDIYEFENPKGMIVSIGGQIPNNLALKLHEAKVKILGTSPLDIDQAEDRHKFSALLDSLGIKQPPWQQVSTIKAAKNFAQKVGYPVLTRPSYVLSGAAMNIIFNEEALKNYLNQAADVSPDHPAVISKFIPNAREIEIDGVAQKGKLMIYAITDHIENAGVHSGDAHVVIPPQRTYLETVRRIKKRAKAIVKALKITGPFNIQFLAKDNDIMVIECNLRASRSFPFVSKTTKYNFIDLAAKAILNYNIEGKYNTLDLDYVAVKTPQFSYQRLKGADPVLYVEMGSTGEAACFGDKYQEAFLKSMLATGNILPRKNLFLSIGRPENKTKLLPEIKKAAAAGFKLFATEHTSDFLAEHGIKNTKLHKISTGRKPNVADYLDEKKIELIINIPTKFYRQETSDGYLIRRKAIDYNIPLVNNVQVARLFLDAVAKYRLGDLQIREYGEYV